MQIGMIGLGRMGSNMTRRLLAGGHEVVAWDGRAEAVDAAGRAGATAAASLDDLVDRLARPRAVWLMVPAAAVDPLIARLAGRLEADDILIDGGNSHFADDLRRARSLAERGLHYVDVGTSGGVWGLERGYCLMIGGSGDAVAHLDPVFRTLAPGERSPAAEDQQRATGTARLGYLHCGPHGAGHFVKMVHNGIEYGLMAAYAEGFDILKRADAGARSREVSAETAPLRNPEHYRYAFDLGAIAEVWRHGSVIGSWLLDLAAPALREDADLARFERTVADSGEARWALSAAIDEGTPAGVLAAALNQRLASQGQDAFALRLLSALRWQFGGHGSPR